MILSLQFVIYHCWLCKFINEYVMNALIFTAQQFLKLGFYEGTVWVRWRASFFSPTLLCELSSIRHVRSWWAQEGFHKGGIRLFALLITSQGFSTVMGEGIEPLSSQWRAQLFISHPPHSHEGCSLCAVWLGYTCLCFRFSRKKPFFGATQMY